MQVKLRTWQRSDQAVLAQLCNNIKIWNNVRDRMPHPYNSSHARTFIEFYRRQNPPRVLAIEADMHLTGAIGLELQDDISRLSAELGYWIGEPYWGQGIATEAVKQMIAYTYSNFGHLIRIYAKVFEGNRASMKVLEKNGFYLESIQRRSAIKNNIIQDEYIWVLLK